jgi:predicted amidohydrolase YtcJ
MAAKLIIHNAKIFTLDPAHPTATAAAVGKDGNFLYVGDDTPALWNLKDNDTVVIDAHHRVVLPGLNDSHLHIIRAALNYNAELRWDGVRSLGHGLQMLSEQAKRTPPGQWVRVVGGWCSYQFEEKVCNLIFQCFLSLTPSQRQPTIDEINAATGDVPCFILCLYGLAFLNAAGVKALNYSKDTKYPGGQVTFLSFFLSTPLSFFLISFSISLSLPLPLSLFLALCQTRLLTFPQVVLDSNDNPTGLLLAKPSALILYSTLALLPRLTADEQLNSTQWFYREMNRLGLTSAIDPGGGGQGKERERERGRESEREKERKSEDLCLSSSSAFPAHYEISMGLARQGKLTIRTAYYLFAQEKGKEIADYTRWFKVIAPGKNEDPTKGHGFCMCGAGENLLATAADFENFLEPRPELVPEMDKDLET